MPASESSATVATRKPGYWQTLVVLFSLGWVLMYANRLALSPVLTTIGREWNLDKARLGLLSSVFFLMYTVLQVPSGLLADRIGRKSVLIPGYLLQGIGGLLSGLAPGAAFFLGSRIAAGTGQGTYYSAQYAIAAAEIPKERRALGTAIINSGMSVGIASGLTIASLMVYRFGLPWRWPFIILGVLTMLLSLAMALIIHEERPGKAQSATTERQANGKPTSGMDAAAWRTLILMGIFNLAVMYGFYVILTWLPYYLQTVRGYSGGEAGLVSTIMPLVAIPAAIISAQRSDKAGSRRKVMLSLLPIAALALILIVASGSRVALYLALVLYGISGKLVVDPLMVALVADVAPKDAYGTVFGILNFVGSAAMVLAPTVTGYIADTTGSFNGGLYLAAALIAVAWAALWLVRERPQAARS